MVDSIVATRPASANGPEIPPHEAHGKSSLRGARWTAIVTGLIGMLLTLSVPLLPVVTDETVLSWPQQDLARSVSAPLVSYSPVSLDVAIPCTAIGPLVGQGGTLVATAPNGAPDVERYGLVAKVTPAGADDPGRIEVVLRDTVLLSAPLDRLAGGDCAIAVSSDATRTTAEITGSGIAPTVHEGDLRPQMVGVFTDLDGAAPAGLQVTAELDSRFTSTPSTLKLIAMVVGVLAMLASLLALHRLDRVDGRRSRRFLPARWWKFGVVDAVIIGTLVLWHFIGATTSDDGYQFTMARAAERAGYMANYFRYYGVPETPFGTPYYEVFGLLAHITPASPFVRLPALIAGIVTWLVLSREVVPRLGAAARANRLALWTGGLVFLAVWLPYNNGLRPEPIVAAGVLLTWCSVERAIATRRLLPAAGAILVAAMTLSVGPSGIICFAALIAGLRPIGQVVVARAKEVGYLALLLPLLASGTAILAVIFADQTLAAVFEMQRVHEVAGPNEKWFDEYLRYQWLLNISPDGSLARRFGIFIMILGVAVSILAMLRKGGRIPGTAAGPARRILGITLGAMVLMMFTPTKWTHHLGIYAGLAGAVAVLTTVAVSVHVLRSPRNRALFAAAVLFVLAMSFTGSNGWWYVSSYSVPWWDKPVSIGGLGAGTMLLGATMAMLLVAVWCHVREPHAGNGSGRTSRLWAIPPLTVAAAAMVLFEVLSLAKGAVAQYPAYSVGRANFNALGGQVCGLANDVLLETDPNASMLQPLSGGPATGLAGPGTVGFEPNGVAADLSADKESSDSVTANSVDSNDNQAKSGNAAGTAGGAGRVGLNGSAVALPYGLDPATTPVLGSHLAGGVATLTTGWYRLPPVGSDGSRGDLISIAAAGRIRSVDADGIVTEGQDLELEYGRGQGDGAAVALGTVAPLDPGPAPSWRNLRVPLDALPVEADVVRIVASDNDRDPKQWLAVTPPRVPQTQTLNSVVGSQTPVLVDWSVGLAFPCQRPFDHRDGVAEVPEYRILPDRIGAMTTNLWQDHFGGGPLGWTQMLLAARTIPSYLDQDWGRDWGEIEQFTSLDPTADPATLDVTTTPRSGLWTPGPINTTF
ncbi:arabinosyltransferase C [Rhodococcus sp. OK611]|uniref:arabinosyltransferase domain-containing protein n=1 Tax=unclassified Rhodococcus (in: high G+C Gram-positive bacteria) TaxID=192944 RepID=UPI000BC6D906|nr:arabinosyltransferase C [Rhodococcus sp. OK611]SNX92286.1 arabinosyltransferase C [Rhodococcus sp. OK270]